jgi:hypothetical protein
MTTSPVAHPIVKVQISMRMLSAMENTGLVFVGIDKELRLSPVRLRRWFRAKVFVPGLFQLREKRVPLTALMTYKLVVLSAGAVGSVVPAAIRQDMPRAQRLIMVFVGCAVATFVSPAVNEYWLPRASEKLHAGVAFCVGVFGMAMIEIALRIVARRGDRIAIGVIDRVVGRIE